MTTDTATKTCPLCFTQIDARASRCSACAARQPDAPGMHRNVPGRVMGGVCAALALQLGLDTTLVRVIAVASLAVTGGLAFWAYAVLWLLTPYDVGGKAPATRFVDWLTGLFSKSPGPMAPPA